MEQAIFCWSGGKDSSYALHQVLSEALFDVKYLLTTVNDEFKRISMHGVQEALLDLQAAAIGIPLLKVRVREGTNEEYEREMEATLLKAKSEGIEHVIFGDIFLEDLRVYRESRLELVGMKAVFPLWKRNTKDLLDDFLRKGFKTITCCTNDGYLGEEWVGREVDSLFSTQLPSQVDPCGENGEYHTFCYEGPLFKQKINFILGEKVYKPLPVSLQDGSSSAKGFWFADLLPAALVGK